MQGKHSTGLLVTVALMALVVGAVAGAGVTYAEVLRLRKDYEDLQRSSFTYYTVGNTFNITDLEIEYGWLLSYVRGKVTNIGNTPVKDLYVFVILRNPDGTSDFDPSDYDHLENIYPGETNEFEISLWEIKEDQKVELLLIY